MEHSYQPGVIVEARGRLWRVDQATRDTITGTSIDNPDLEPRTFYLPLEQAGIRLAAMDRPPSEPGDAALHDLFLRATRMTMMHGTAPLASLQRSRVIPTNYQLVPVMMALDMPRVRLLIADDVGLGKTIEAGLITVELLARKQAERVLVLTPPNLKEQWRDAFRHFFHLEFESLSGPEIRKLDRRLPPGANPWAHFPYIIASIDYAKRDAVRHLILSQRWDLVIIDEAHGVSAPVQGSRGGASKERHEFARELARRCRHLVLATATPHNGYTVSFASLLRLLDEVTDERGRVIQALDLVAGDDAEPRIHRQRAGRHVVQRRRQDVQAWFERENKPSPFPKRDSREVFIEPSEPELRVFQAFQQYQRFVFGERGERGTHVLAKWMVMHFLRRATSSPRALRISLRNRIARLQERLERTEDEIDESEVARGAEDALKSAALDTGDTDLFSEEEADSKLDRLSVLERTHTQDEIRFLEGVLDAVTKMRTASDTKLRELKRLLADPGQLGGFSRTIVFTRYKDTMDYLAEELAKDGAYAIFTIDGSLSDKARAERIAAFQNSDRALLVATDAISEGLNLQYAANQLVHYELPWNPNRLEQRNGRVDRFRQPERVVKIRTLINERSFDVVVFRKLIEKAQRIREEYGFLPGYFSDEKYTEELLLELIDENLTEQRFLQPGLFGSPTREELAPEERRIADRMRDESFYGQAAFHLPDVEERLRHSQETIGSPAEVERLVVAAFRYLNWRVDELGRGRYRIARAGATPVQGLADDLGEVTFDADIAAVRPDVEHLDIAHPVVSKLLAHIKRQSYLEIKNARTAVLAKELPPGTPAHAVFHLRTRFRVGGEENPQLIESLTPVAISLDPEHRLALGDAAQALLSAPPATPAFSDEMIANLIRRALELDDLEGRLERAVHLEKERLRAERKHLKARLQEAYPSEAAWLTGIDEVTPAPHDILALSVIVPGRATR